jgi:hypothetical protein
LAWLLQCASVVGAGVGTADVGHAVGGLFAIHSASLLSYVGGGDGFGVITITGYDGAGVGACDGDREGRSVSGPKQQDMNAPSARGQHVP